MEQQKDNSVWQECAKVNDSLAYTMKSLTSGIVYRFRVRACNIHGFSEPSQPSEEVNIDENMENKLNEHIKINVQNINGNGFDQTDGENRIVIRQGGDFKARFILLEELGKGRFGVVHKVIERETEQTFAAKIVKCIKAKDKVSIREEIAIMKSLNHPKLLQLAATFENAREIMMIME